MQVYINDKPKEVTQEQSLFQILDAMEIKGVHERKGIAIAVDDEVISRDHWDSYHPKENSKIIIITATQGG